MHLRKASFTSGRSTLTKNSNGGCEFSVSEEGLAVNLCKRIIGVWVTRRSFYSCPLANGAVPSHNAVQNTAVILQEKNDMDFQVSIMCAVLEMWREKTQ